LQVNWYILKSNRFLLSWTQGLTRIEWRGSTDGELPERVLCSAHAPRSGSPIAERIERRRTRTSEHRSLNLIETIRNTRRTLRATRLIAINLYPTAGNVALVVFFLVLRARRQAGRFLPSFLPYSSKRMQKFTRKIGKAIWN